MTTRAPTRTNGAAVKSRTGTMHSTSIDLAPSLREQIVALCNKQLANTLDLYTQTKQAHWNVKGMHFSELHILFDTMAESIFAYIDVIAERATALGGTALGTARMAANTSELPEFPSDTFDGTTMIRLLVDRWAQYAASVRAAVNQANDTGDLDTSDLFTDVSRTADKMLWFAEAHLQGDQSPE
jgi:starvation-inducible DNA-binding protein